MRTHVDRVSAARVFRRDGACTVCGRGQREAEAVLAVVAWLSGVSRWDLTRWVETDPAASRAWRRIRNSLTYETHRVPRPDGATPIDDLAELATVCHGCAELASSSGEQLELVVA